MDSKVGQGPSGDDSKDSNKREEATPAKGAASSALAIVVLKQPHWSYRLIAASYALGADIQDLPVQGQLFPVQ